MHRTYYDEVYNKLIRKITSIKWLQKHNIDKHVIDKTIRSEKFTDDLRKMCESLDFSAVSTINLCNNIIKAMTGDCLSQNWLKYIYEYTLNKNFPDAVTIELSSKLNNICELYLRIFRLICDAQKYSNDNSWKSTYPIVFLTQEEQNSLEHPEEYKKFIKIFSDNYVYEMMKLNEELTGFTTLDHVCGVHSLSLYIARQLKSIEIPVDLGRVSGAAAGHDLGKYGCRNSELKRVPHLHYYYTDQWFKRANINYIRNIAINHSTWDLELENLSLESLILIYSDFRVKNEFMNGKSHMKLYSLEDSFYIILGKLENVDIAKKNRYKKVYAKLKDFEDFLLDLGVDVKNPGDTIIIKKRCHDYTLLQGNQIVQNLKYLAINHNINLMYQLRDEYSLGSILELARSETDWKVFREYIRIFQEYSTYLTQKQKLQTLKFLYENLIHPEDDIRRHCAELMGKIIATFDEDYRKEIPLNVKLSKSAVASTDLLKEYLELMLNPGYKFIPVHKFNIGYSISIMVKSLFSLSKKSSISNYINILTEFYREQNYRGIEYDIFLIETAKYIPLDYIKEDDDTIFSYIFSKLQKRNSIVRLATLETILIFIDKLSPNHAFIFKIKEYFSSVNTKSKIPAENLLLYKIDNSLKLMNEMNTFANYCELNRNIITDIFLNNLKTATDWVKKRNQIDLLLYHALNNIQSMGLHTAIHFCNLLKVSAIESVRNRAGNAILEIMPYISLAERNEVAVELIRALELEGNRFTEYIPEYAGASLLWLQPKELNEIIDDCVLKVKTSNPNLKSLIIKTIGITISNYNIYRKRFRENENSYKKRLISMLGILLNGLGSYNSQVKQSSFSVIGKDIFDTNSMNLKEKILIFNIIAKKIITLITENENKEPLLLIKSASLNHIYRFISDFSFAYGDINIEIPNKVAFFPGTFDPFSLSHKEIAKHIRDLGFEVYLAIDEFSWSKKTLPSLLRKNIINMSISDELSIYLYPDIYPTNIANPDDLKILKENFPNSVIYICVGSDVLLNASGYKKTKVENSIYTFSHIIFERGKNKKLNSEINKIDGNVIILTLSSKYSEISSTQIRKLIDSNRDISTLVDPMAEEYIYNSGFYQRESQDKALIKPISLKTQLIKDLDKTVLDFIQDFLQNNNNDSINKIINIFKKSPSRILLLKDIITDKTLGFSVFHVINSTTLYDEFNNYMVSKYIRKNSTGRIILLDGIYMKYNHKNNKELEQILLTETISICVSNDYEYAIYKDSISPKLHSDSIYELLELYGFTKIKYAEDNDPVYAVNISNPCIINLDIQDVIKEPFRHNAKIKQVIHQSRRKLMEAINKLYPGELLISFNVDFVYQAMIDKICKGNNVPTERLIPTQLGKSMCVPYGDMLRRYIIPNTVTKALHTEKLFFPGIDKFIIGEFPHYLDLKAQVRMIKSFNRPVILVDDLLHKGYRMKALDPIFKNENINIEKIIVGVLSGRGKDLMDMQKREVDGVYFIPRLKLWFNENAFYPFIGGDSIWRGSYPDRNLLPSINMILPYTYPAFIKNIPKYLLYNFSKVCLENSIQILKVIENEYHLIHEKNLTLSCLGQVFTVPRCPDHGQNMKYNLNLAASTYLENDLELLIRMKHAFE
ncbi:cytidyltransferase [Clostridium fermenticellae]|uniref:nicotinate-nucleotide adenylyltransferase n=1 Tax=Clostridium fermenticellae TaxID=2068654 RepID=A0A386H3Q6_9CLOT|nr:cytidyltransferase [Clostridium fermenticellae]AYD40284.1 cytidyltransferase [Clostridium fermenticellae]